MIYDLSNARKTAPDLEENLSKTFHGGDYDGYHCIVRDVFTNRSPKGLRLNRIRQDPS